MEDIEDMLDAMEYPYSCIGPENESDCWGYGIDEIRREILIEEEEADAGDFPHNIAEHFWIREGCHDGDEWMACGLLTNGNYFFYTGGCDYTGFDCQGFMQLWVSESWKNIVDHAMTEKEYNLYVEQTEDPCEDSDEDSDEDREEAFNPTDDTPFPPFASLPFVLLAGSEGI